MHVGPDPVSAALDGRDDHELIRRPWSEMHRADHTAPQHTGLMRPWSVVGVRREEHIRGERAKRFWLVD